MADGSTEVEALPLLGVVGFNGKASQGLLLHPDDEHLIYPLGSTVVVRNLLNNTQHFLQKDGHDATVTCTAISPSGRYLASGQIAQGFSALVIIWDLETCEVVHRLKMHKGRVESISFSHDEKYLATLGGEDDKRVVVWKIATGEGLCGATVANDFASTVKFLNTRNDEFVTMGRYNIRHWKFDEKSRQVRYDDIRLGQLKRTINCCVIDDEDKFMYCGTATGDLLQISVKHNIYKMGGPKNRFVQGITAVAKTNKGNIIVGAGDGTVAVLLKDSLKVVRKLEVKGAVSSLQLNAAGDHFFVGTKECNIYLVHLNSFEYELRNTCHSSGINDIAFAYDYSKLFATCAKGDIRVWHAKDRTELLRIAVRNLECLCVCFSVDGKRIMSGWSDGNIRAFTPQTGKLMFTIHDAHAKGVTAIASSHDSRTVVSGGGDGQVRVWEVSKSKQQMLASMKEHKSAVNNVKVNQNDTECLSASADGSCIVWNLERYNRQSAMFASTQFKSVDQLPDESQILTTGTDRKITFWDAADGNPIRIMEGSSQEITSLCISPDGESFASVGADKLVRLWGYDEGRCFFQGVGHSDTIRKVKVSPDQSFMVTVGDEGAIFIWEFPEIPQTAVESY